MDEAQRFALTITRKADRSLHFDPDPKSIGFANALSFHFAGNESLEEKMQLAVAHAIAVEERRAVQKPFLFIKSELIPGYMGPQGGAYGFQGQEQHLELDSYSPNHLAPTPPSHGNSPQRVRSLQERTRPQISPNGNSRRPNSTSGPGRHDGPPGSSLLKLEGSSVIKKGRKGRLTDSQRERAKLNRVTGSVCEKHRKARTKCDPERCPDNALYDAMKSRQDSGASLGMWNSPPTENKRSPSISSGYLVNVSNPSSVWATEPNPISNNPSPFQQPPLHDPFPTTPDNQYIQPTSGPPIGKNPDDLLGMTSLDQPITGPGQLFDGDVDFDNFPNLDGDVSNTGCSPFYNSGPFVPNIGTEIPRQGLAFTYFSGDESFQSRPTSVCPVSLADLDLTYMNDGTQTYSWGTHRSPRGARKPELKAKKWLEKLKRYISKFRRTFKV